jgi:hypothetical protein
MTDYSFGCDRLDVYRTQTQAIADCRDTEHDMSAKWLLPRRWLRVKRFCVVLVKDQQTPVHR